MAAGKSQAVLIKKPRRGISGKGQQTAFAILLAAEELIISSGYHSFSLRKVAETAGITLGNLQYYYPSKDTLIAAMLNNTIQRYIDRFDEIRIDAGQDAETQFIAVISEAITDLNQKTTTMFFPEVWSLSNHYPHAVKIMDDMYGKYRQILIEIMAVMNPALSGQQLHRLAVFISSSIEGHTMFIGYKKPWTEETGNIVSMASQSFLWLIYSGSIPE